MKDLQNYVIPFTEKEVETKHPFVNTAKHIKKHEECIKILEAIQDFEKRRAMKIQNIQGFGGTFPRLRAKYVNDVDTINRCIVRLQLKHINIVNNF